MVTLLIVLRICKVLNKLLQIFRKTKPNDYFDSNCVYLLV